MASLGSGSPADADPTFRFREADAEAVYRLAGARVRSRLADLIRNALQVIHQAFLRFSPDGLALSFNGGKDCTVLLHLFAAALYRHRSHSPASSPPHIRALYIKCPAPFEAVESFIHATTLRYSVDLYSCQSDLKHGLGQFLNHHNHYQQVGAPIQAILIGTRSTDPNGASLTSFDPTDRDWPPITRVHPILDWSYHDIWDFLRALNVPWCELYNFGYTSLGSVTNTWPNPYLQCEGENERNIRATKFKPAWELSDGSLERAGRTAGTVPSAT